MTDRFSHPLSIGPSSMTRSRQSPSRASVSSKTSGSHPAVQPGPPKSGRADGITSKPSESQLGDIDHGQTSRNRSRASTTSRSRIPLALQGVGQEELDIYLVRWDLLDDAELARACGTSTSGLPPSPPQLLRPLSIDDTLDASPRSVSNELQGTPRLSRSSSSISSLTTPKTRPRPLKRFSTQILALTLPPAADEDPDPSTTRRRSEGLFPPSPPGSVPNFGARSHENLQAIQPDLDFERTSPAGHATVQTHLHPLRVLSRLARELGETCLKLEEENQSLRAGLAPHSGLEQEPLRPNSDVGPNADSVSRTGVEMMDTPRKGSVERNTMVDEAEESQCAEERRLSNLFREEDQLSIHDSLNEALSTHLASPAISTFSLQARHGQGDPLSADLNNPDDPQATIKARPFRPAAGSPSQSPLATPSRETAYLTYNRRRAGSSSTFASGYHPSTEQSGRTPTIVVRSTAAEAGVTSNEQAVADEELLGTSVPRPRDKSHRSSWTDSLWSWTGSAPRDKRSSSKQRKERGQAPDGSIKRGPEFQPGRSRASTTTSETAAIGRPILSPPITADDPDEGDDEHVFRYGDSGNTPSFRAIFLATRLLTPDMSSILSTASKKRLQGETLSRMAYTLVRNARDGGISLRHRPAAVRLVREEPLDHETKKPPTKRSKRHSVLGIPSSIGNALASPVQALLGSGSGSTTVVVEGDTARKQLLRSISSRDMAGTLATPGIPVKGKSPDRSAVSTPIVSPGEHDGESTPPLVEMDAFIATKDKPPTMLPRRNTMHNLHGETSPTLKLASRFGDESAELAPYTDKFGFVYDLRYVRMLLDLKAASEEDTLAAIPSEEDDMPRVKRDPRASFDEHALERVKSGVSTQSNSSPGSVNSPLPETPGSALSTGPVSAHRPRSSTLAVFNPSPAKPSASHQDVTVSSRGALNLRPTLTANGGRKDSVLAQKAKLDSLAVRNRKPVSSLLNQLGEVQDVREAETARQWDQFIKYRRGKASSRKGSVSVRHRPTSGVDHGSWQDDLVGIANIGDGKTGQEVMKRFKTLIVSSGIPINMRASIWAECSGAKDAFIPGEYHEILSVHKQDEHPVLGDIEKDVKRTFPTNVFFGGDGVGCEKLRRLLTAYAWHDPSIGYCQGMNLVAATLLLIYEDEERAYWTFVCLIRNLLPRDWFTSTLQGSMIEQAVLGELVAENLPKIGRHFDELGLDLSAVTFGWMLSLFTSCLPIETVLRIWDCFMIEGKDVIILSALAILKTGQAGILECDNVGDLFDYLNAITERLWSPDKLVQLQNTLKTTITPNDLAARRQRQADAMTSACV